MAEPHIFNQYRDEELLALMQNHQQDAFDEIYKRYSGKIWSYFYRMLWKDDQLAQDCTQELFLKIIKNATGFDTEKKFSTWMYSIAHNMCKNEYRKKSYQNEYSMQRNPSEVDKPHNFDLKKFKLALQEAVNQMDEERKALYLLRFQDQITVPEISQILNIPEGTVKSRLFYLAKDLKENLKAFENILTYP